MRRSLEKARSVRRWATVPLLLGCVFLLGQEDCTEDPPPVYSREALALDCVIAGNDVFIPFEPVLQPDRSSLSAWAGTFVDLSLTARLPDTLFCALSDAGYTQVDLGSATVTFSLQGTMRPVPPEIVLPASGLPISTIDTAAACAGSLGDEVVVDFPPVTEAPWGDGAFTIEFLLTVGGIDIELTNNLVGGAPAPDVSLVDLCEPTDRSSPPNGVTDDLEDSPRIAYDFGRDGSYDTLAQPSDQLWMNVVGYCVGYPCNDYNDCTVDECDPRIFNRCYHDHEPDGTPCTDGGIAGTCQAGVCDAEPVLVLEQASKQVGSDLVCTNIFALYPGQDYYFILSPLVVESDGNNNVSLSGSLRVFGLCEFGELVLNSAEITVSVAGATPTTLTGTVPGLPSNVPNVDFLTCDSCASFDDCLFDIVVPVPTEMSVDQATVDFAPTDIVVSITDPWWGGTTMVSVDDSRCELVPNGVYPSPSTVTFNAQPAGPCDLDPCNDGNSCTIDTCTVDPVDGSRICDNSSVSDGTACDDFLPTAGTCSAGRCSATDTVLVACVDNDGFLPDGWTFGYDLSVTPLGPVEDGIPVDMELTGTAKVAGAFINYALSTFPTLTELDLTALRATVAVRSGATGPDVPLAFDEPLPATVPLPLVDDPTACEQTGLVLGVPLQSPCVLDPYVLLPLESRVATYTPTGGPGGEILFGWDESSFPPTFAVYDGNPGSVGTELVLGSIEEAFACQMGWVDVITDPLLQLPPEYEFNTLDDDELLSLPIPTTALCGNGVVEAPEECDDGNLSNTDGCANDCTVEPITEVVPVACSNPNNNSIMQHDMRLTVDPVDRVEAGSPFGVEVSGEAVISEFWLDAVQNVIVGGATEIVVDRLSYKVSARSGATGTGVFLGLGQPYADGTCSDSPTGPSCTTDSDCGGSTCKAVLQVPISNSFTFCDSLNKGTQWANNGFCVISELRVPLETKTTSFVADASGSVLFGWEEGAPPIPPAAPTQSWIAAGVLTVESECYMGTENAGQTALVPLPDADLIELPILE